ncbi:Apoptosis-stimulating of p53 protein 2 [Armadillidium vulgare]|nr:Apoptosis-stimulating of p53 protein 2 [Armadillidium vulgare]
MSFEDDLGTEYNGDEGVRDAFFVRFFEYCFGGRRGKLIGNYFVIGEIRSGKRIHLSVFSEILLMIYFVDSSLLNAASLSSDLEAMRLLFSEKEKELVDAASKVEELTKQLEDVRSGRGGAVIHQNGNAGTNINNTQNHHFQIHHQELDKLRRELLYRNSVNREASTRVATQKEALSTRKDEIARIDKRIAELQQRLYRKRFLNQQLASQISAATQAKQAQLKAVQQKAKREGNKDNSLDDITTDERRTIEDIAHFERGAQDPKYQTLPYNTKFSSGNKEGSSQSINSGTSLGPPQTSAVPNCGSNVVTRTVHSIPTHLPSKGHASAPLTSGSSVVAGSTASHTVPIPSPQMSHPATSSLNRGHQNGSLRPNYLHQQQQTSHLPLYSSKIPQSDDSNSNKQLQSQQTIHNGSSLQKHNNQSIAANGQPRSTPLSNSHQCSLQPVNKDVENVRALGFTPGGSNSSSVPGVKSMSSTNGASVSVDESSREASTGSVKIKPSLPPKPSPHSKPTPPPRQKGDPLAGSTESINLTGVTRNNSQSRPQVFRYASQNVILSTYTQQQQQQQQQSSQEQKPQSLQSEPKQIDSKQQQDSQSAAQFQQSSNSGNSTLSQQYKEAKQLLSNETGEEAIDDSTSLPTSTSNSLVVRRLKKGNLKTPNSSRAPRRVSFDPLALLLDASLEGELELVKRTATEVTNPSAANDEGITALP